MSYNRTRHVWNGEGRTRIEDVAEALASLGYSLYVKKHVRPTSHDENDDDLLNGWGELIDDICPDKGIKLSFPPPKRTHHV
jgi:hypothetical protein